MPEAGDTIGRISAAVRAHEAAILDIVPENEQYTEDQPLRWMCLTQDLAAAGSAANYGGSGVPITVPTVATANPVDWQFSANGGKGGYAVDTTLTYYVQESTGKTSYNIGDWLLCRAIMTAGGAAWEPIASQKGLLIGKVTTIIPILGGGAGVCEIYDSLGNDLGYSLSVYGVHPYIFGIGVLTLIAFDSKQGHWYPVDYQTLFVGLSYSNTNNINNGATGDITITDDQGANSRLLTGVRAVGGIVRSQAVLVTDDYVEVEPFAVPFQWPLLSTPAAQIVVGASGTINIFDATGANPPGGATTVTSRAAYRTLQPAEPCLTWWDYYTSQYYSIPLQAVLIGQFNYAGGVAIKKTQTTFAIFDDQFNPLGFTILNVRTFTDFVKNDYAQLFWDFTNNEFFAIPLSRPCLGIVATAIAAGGVGTVTIYDCANNNFAVVASNVRAPFGGAFAVGQSVLLFWDFKQQCFFATPAFAPAYGQYVLGGPTTITTPVALSVVASVAPSPVPSGFTIAGGFITPAVAGIYRVSVTCNMSSNTPTVGTPVNYDLILTDQAASQAYRATGDISPEIQSPTTTYSLSGNLIIGYTLNSTSTTVVGGSVNGAESASVSGLFSLSPTNGVQANLGPASMPFFGNPFHFESCSVDIERVA